MSFTQAAEQHWNEIEVLCQICVMMAQSVIQEHHFNDDVKENDSMEQIDELMDKIMERVIVLAKEVEHLSDIHRCFWWRSRSDDDIDLNKLEHWADAIIAFCDKLSKSITSKPKKLCEMNEIIEINRTKHLTLKHLSYALNEDGVDSNKERLKKSLRCILESIELCAKTNYLIKALNKGIDDEQNGEIEKREESDLVCMYHFAANLCQKMTKFAKSLELINYAMVIMKQQLAETYKDGMVGVDEPLSSSEGDDDDIMFDSDGNSVHSMSVENILMDSCDDIQMNEDVNEYVIDIEFNDQIKEFMKIKEKEWKNMEHEEKLFYITQREMFDCLLTRGLAHSNLKNYKLAFYDSYLCTLIHPNDVTAWNNRAFAWYQLGKYLNCVNDCNFALNKFDKILSTFSRGLLIGNRGLAEYKLRLYHRAVSDLNLCLRHSPQSRLAREALAEMHKEFTAAIYYGCTRINIDKEKDEVIDIPFVIAEIISNYGVGIDFNLIPECHNSTIVYRS